MDHQELAERLCRMHVEHMREISRLAQTAIAQGEDAVLISLYDIERPVFAGEFIEKLGLTTGRIANILKKLEEKGLVSRVSDREDRRRVRVSLTEAGRRHAEQKFQAMVRIERALLDQLGPADAEELARIIDRLAAASEALKSQA